MKLILENWNNFIVEAVKDPSYAQRIYKIIVKLKIDKHKGGDREQTFTEIRGIPGVTVVTVDPTGTGHDETYYYSTLNIKFELVGGADALLYREKIFIPGLRKIKGSIVRFVGPVKEIGKR